MFNFNSLIEFYSTSLNLSELVNFPILTSFSFSYVNYALTYRMEIISGGKVSRENEF